MKRILITATLPLALVALAAPPTTAPAPTPSPAAVVTAAPAATVAPVGSAPAGQPRAAFSETSFDFGKVKSSDPQFHDFIVTNLGNAVLKITAVQPGCGCTTAKPWDPEIAPGQTGKIPIQFNPANFSGTVSKGISVTCNDPTNPTVFLSISATIWKPIDIQPQFASFIMVDGEETNETKTVRIINNTEQDLVLQPPQSSSPSFLAELKPVRPGKEFELLIQYAGALSNVSSHANIRIDTSLSNMPILSVTASLVRQAAVLAMPQAIHLPNSSAGQRFTYPLMVRNNGRTPVKLSEPVVSAEGVNTRIEEVEAGKTFRVTLDFKPGFHIDAGKPVELALKTSHPKQPALKVPIYQLAPTPAPALPQIIPPPPVAPAAAGK